MGPIVLFWRPLIFSVPVWFIDIVSLETLTVQNWTFSAPESKQGKECNFGQFGRNRLTISILSSVGVRKQKYLGLDKPPFHKKDRQKKNREKKFKDGTVMIKS